MKEHKRTGWVDQISWRFGRVAMVMPSIIVVIIIYEVFMRYVLERPTIWVNELSLWMGGWIYLTAGLYTMQQRGHIRITILYEVVPKRIKRLFNVLSTFFLLAWAAATIYGGFNEASSALLSWERYGTAWNPPIPAVTQPLILVVMLVMAIQAVSNLVMDWNALDGEGSGDFKPSENIEEIIRAQHQRARD